jgi:hypothetical protein
VWELADGDHTQRKLFSRAMRIGRDHIASTVYTIAFATAGASLSVLLLIAVYNRPLLQVLQTEQFAGEVIRTLVGSIGLVLAVPLTTAIGVAVVRAGNRGGAASRRREPEQEEFEDLEPAPALERAEAEAPASAEGPVTAPAGTVSAGTAADGTPVEAATEVHRHRRRRPKPVDDYGFADLRDPDEKGTGTSGRPTR